jgi:splicing suppressor protein 51
VSEPQACASCSAANASLLRCGRCKSVQYCDKVCQKSHWKAHKQSCAQVPQGHSESTSQTQTEQPSPASERDKKPFTAISNNKFLHDRTEEETFKLLIDMLHIRQRDEYVLAGELMDDTIYDGATSSEKAFRTLIRKAKAVPGMLPPWWNQESLSKCLSFARTSEDFSLSSAQEKSDIQETWKDNLMPMKLRIVSERMYGYNPGGTKGEPMLAMKMEAESGEGEKRFDFTIDHAANACTPQ